MQTYFFLEAIKSFTIEDMTDSEMRIPVKGLHGPVEFAVIRSALNVAC